MKYMIVYLIRGEAEKYQRKIVNEISSEFNIRNLNPHIPPHLTLKVPFQTKRIGEIERKLKQFSQSKKPSLIISNRFSHFNKKVIYMNADFSKSSNEIYKNLIKTLEELSWMRWRKFDKTLGNFHATIGYSKTPKQFKRIWEYLKSKEFNFKLEFDNITILKKPKTNWKIHKIYNIK